MSFSCERPMRPPSTVNTLRRPAPKAAAFALMTSNVRYMVSRAGERLASYEHGGTARDDRAPMRRAVAHAGGGFVLNEHRGRALDDRIRGADARALATEGRRRQVADEDGGRTRWQDRATHVWNGRYGGCLHRADVQVADPGRGRHQRAPEVAGPKICSARSMNLPSVPAYSGRWLAARRRAATAASAGR